MLSVKDVTKLEKKRFRDDLGVFLIEGKKVFSEAREAKLEMEQILVSEVFLRENREFLQEHGIAYREMVIISQHNAERLSETTTPSGIFAVIKKPEVQLEQLLTAQKIVVLEDIRDPGNLGTILRTSDWFGIDAVIVSDTGADIYNGKVIRATMGSLFHLKIYTSSDLETDLQELKKNGYQLIATRPEVKSSVESIRDQKSCVIFGNESTGTTSGVDQLATAVFSIPKYGQAESLNVAVAFGITMHQLLQTKK